MITFLVALVLVFVAVDLFVRFAVDPFILASRKKKKVAKSYTPKYDSTFKLATVTMYDGGKPHEDPSSKCTAEEKISKDVNDGDKQ